MPCASGHCNAAQFNDVNKAGNKKEVEILPSKLWSDTLDDDHGHIVSSAPLQRWSFHFKGEKGVDRRRRNTLMANKSLLIVLQGGVDERFLRAVEVEIVGRQDCSKLYSETRIAPRMICAGTPEGGKDSCF